MKANNVNNVATKKGAASLYVVIFTTLLLGIITLSFIRIIISETTQTSNTDLSQSAYDSALAGVEDAKVAILRYHDCLSGRNTNSNYCQNLIGTMQKGIENQSCDVVKNVLGRSANTAEGKQEVILQESNVTGNNNSSTLLQAYTCIKIAEELEDYRTNLNDGFRTRILPLRTKNIDQVSYITVKWYSKINGSSTKWMQNTSRFNFYPATSPSYTPPVVAVQFIQADKGGFVPNTDFNVPNGSTNTNRAEAILYPVSSGGEDRITAARFTSSANKMVDDSGSGGTSNRLYRANCNGFSKGSEFACEIRIDLPRPYRGGERSDNATFLRIDLPYSAPSTDVAIQMYNAAGNPINFEGVQASVDSTGRANDLYRRIESRIELVDIYYPYPEFAVQADGSSNNEDAISKNFYSTKNCWYSNSGSVDNCTNNNKSTGAPY